MNSQHPDPEGEELGNDSSDCWSLHHTWGSAGTPHCWEFGILESSRSLFTHMSFVSAGAKTRIIEQNSLMLPLQAAWLP